nr:MAG TPA: hypothetical protein [Caudoviricetes sp.]
MAHVHAAAFAPFAHRRLTHAHCFGQSVLAAKLPDRILYCWVHFFPFHNLFITFVISMREYYNSRYKRSRGIYNFF